MDPGRLLTLSNGLDRPGPMRRLEPAVEGSVLAVAGLQGEAYSASRLNFLAVLFVVADDPDEALDVDAVARCEVQ